MKQHTAQLAEPKQAVEPEYVGVEQAEIMTGVSRWTWRRWAYDGRIASVKLSKRLLIPVSEIRRLLAEGYRPALGHKGGR